MAKPTPIEEVCGSEREREKEREREGGREGDKVCKGRTVYTRQPS